MDSQPMTDDTQPAVGNVRMLCGLCYQDGTCGFPDNCQLKQPAAKDAEDFWKSLTPQERTWAIEAVKATAPPQPAACGCPPLRCKVAWDEKPPANCAALQPAAASDLCHASCGESAWCTLRRGHSGPHGTIASWLEPAAAMQASELEHRQAHCEHHWCGIAFPAIERPEAEPAWCSLCGALKSRGIHSPTTILEVRAKLEASHD